MRIVKDEIFLAMLSSLSLPNTLYIYTRINTIVTKYRCTTSTCALFEFRLPVQDTIFWEKTGFEDGKNKDLWHHFA